LTDDEYKSALLSGVVVLGLKPEYVGSRWAPAHEFSPILSAIITTSKALVVLRAYKIYMSLRNGDSLTVHELVKDIAEWFMVLSSYCGLVTPMNCLLR
jgi:hypothetical protein